MSNARDVRTKKIPVSLGEYEDEQGQLVERKGSLRFDLNAFAEIEEYYGTIDGAMQALEKGSIKALRVVLWAGLLHENTDEEGNPTLTVREVGSWIDISQVQELATSIAQAMKDALPEEEKPSPGGAPVPLAQKPT